MEKSINLEIFEFKNKIIDCINSVDLPIIIKRDTVALIYNELAMGTEAVLNQDRINLQKALEEKKAEENSEGGEE